MSSRAAKSKGDQGDSPSAKNIIFFHPDLGIGGAERLVIDAAVGLQKLGHKVVVYTSHCDPSHCFDEARDGTLDVRVRGNWLFPATILGHFKILFAVLRQFHLLAAITLTGELARLKPTAFFVDQLSAGIPVLRWRWPGIRILFYCHFPDLLLVKNRSKWWKRVWRLGFDWLEGWGMRRADRIVVNSAFTRSVVESIWTGLGGERGLGIVYPCVDTREDGETNREGTKELWRGKKVILSINRFEKKKDVGLAIKAFARLEPNQREAVRLVIAGGYDNRVGENVEYHSELVSLCDSLDLKAATTKNVVTALNIPTEIDVLFLLSVPAQLKTMLLNGATLLVYTPSNEHFGIVPLEAMLAGVPVLAANSGGPLETVVEGETGWLRSANDISQWTEVMQKVLHGMADGQLQKMGDKGKRWVKNQFSETKMASRLDEEVAVMVGLPRQSATEIPDVLLGMGFLGMVFTVVFVIVFRLLR